MRKFRIGPAVSVFPDFKLRLFSTLSLSTLTLRYASSVGAHHFHTSAKQNRGVEELFLDLTQQMISTADENAKKRRADGTSSSSAPGSGGSNVFGRSSGNNITIVDDSQVPEGGRKRPCCGGGGGTATSDSVITGIPVDNNLAASSQ